MATYEITAPDGQTYEVTAPDGATEEEVLAYVQQNMAAQPQQAASVSAPQQQAAPGDTPLSYKGMMQDFFGKVAQGGMRAGIPGALMGAGEGALANFGKLMDRGAYNAGGAVTDALAPHVSPEVAGGAGYAANVATQAIPTVLGAVVGNMAKPAFQSAGKRVMQSALKPPLAENMSGDADRAIKALLEEGVNVTGPGMFGKGGTGKLQGLVTASRQSADDMINAASGNIQKSRVATEVADELAKAKAQPNAAKDMRGVSKALDDFLDENPGDISVQWAQQLKRGGQKAVEESYGKLSRGREAGIKAINRGLRVAIEDIVPEVGPINKRTGDLTEALKLVNRRVGIADNRDLMGLSMLSQNPAQLAAMMADRSYLFKSLIARLLHSGNLPVLLGGGAGAAYGYSGSRPD